MNDLDAEKLRPVLEQLAGGINPIDSDAYFEVVQKDGRTDQIHANAAGFVCAGIHLIRQGLNAAHIPDDKPLVIELRQFTIQKDKSGWVITYE